MKLHSSLWRGRLDCLFRRGAAAIPFGVDVDRADLTFGVRTIDRAEAVTRQDLDGYDLVVCSGDLTDDLHLPDLAGPTTRVVCVVEYTIGTRLRIVLLDTERSLPRRIYSVLWNLRQELKRRRAFRRSAGVQTNGYPAYEAYRRLNPNTLLYLDSRMRPEPPRHRRGDARPRGPPRSRQAPAPAALRAPRTDEGRPGPDPRRPGAAPRRPRLHPRHLWLRQPARRDRGRHPRRTGAARGPARPGRLRNRAGAARADPRRRLPELPPPGRPVLHLPRKHGLRLGCRWLRQRHVVGAAGAIAGRMEPLRSETPRRSPAGSSRSTRTGTRSFAAAAMPAISRARTISTSSSPDASTTCTRRWPPDSGARRPARFARVAAPAAC